jgi:hypothetical protein
MSPPEMRMIALAARFRRIDRARARSDAREKKAHHQRYSGQAMNKHIRAEYDADTESLRLIDPLHGIENHQQILIAIEEKQEDVRDWRALRGSLPSEAAEDLRRVLIAAGGDEN